MGTLFIVATPIGNLEDITIRAIKTLFSVDYIACEDTRRTGVLLGQLNKLTGSDPETYRIQLFSAPKLISFYDEIEEQRTPEITDFLLSGENVALVSDAGTPLISDPGYKLVKACIEKGIKIVPIPGPSALITALTVSGLPPDKFMFLGYLPEKSTRRIKLLNALRANFSTPPLTCIIYCSPHKLQHTLADIKTVLGNIEIVIARELTKIHEEIWRGKISEAISYYKNPKGEFVLLLTYKRKVL